MAQIFPIDFEEKLTMAQDDYILFSDSEDGNKIKKAQYSNLKGEKGDPGTPGTPGTPGKDGEDGEAATITVGSVSTLPAGSSATVTNSGTTSAAVLNFGIPEGATGTPGTDGQDGAAATITVGTTTTLPAGSSATVENVGTSQDAILNFGIPKGDSGTGSGDVIGPASSTDGHLAVFDGATGKLIKDGGAVPSPTTVVDSLDSTSTTSALSANQGKVLDGKISDLFGLGKFLSLWDATTGLPISFPLEIPYTYTTGDYFLVETVSTATPPVNYKPNGSSYTGTASSTTESEELEVGDIYIYDGTTWLLQLNHGKTVSFSEIAGSPSDNTALGNALSAKQDSLTLPATPTSGHLVTWGADNKTLADGGAVPTGVPAVGTNGQVLTVVSGVAAWANASGGDVMVSSQANNILTTGMKIWAGTQANYEALGTYDNNTVYLTI